MATTMGSRSSTESSSGLFDRDRELALIDEVLDATIERRGPVLVLDGPAGIGKTSLCATAEARAGDRGITVRRVRGTPLGAARPWGIARAVLGHDVPTTAARADDVAAVHHALGLLLDELVERGPLVVIVDDAHWADPESLALFDRDDSGCGLVLAARPPVPVGGPLDRLTNRRGSVHHVVGPLGRDAVAALVEQRAPAHVASASRLHASTGGNPFLCSELCDELAGSPVAGAHTTPDELLPELLPERVRRWILTRMGELGDDAVQVARAVAVLGAETNLTLLAEVIPLARGRVATALDALVAAGLLTDATRPAYVHPLVAEIVHDDIGTARRETLHRRAARLLVKSDADPLVVAGHLLRTSPSADAWVTTACGAAASASMAQAAPARAAEILEWGLAAPLDVAVRIELLVDLARAQVAMGDDGAFARLRRALELLPEPSVDPRAYAEIGEALYAAGRFDDAVEAFRAGLEAATGSPVDHLDEARLLVGLDTAGLLLGRHLEPARSRIAAIAAAPPDTPTLAEQVLLAMAAAEPALGIDRPRALADQLMELALRDLPADAIGRAILEPLLGSMAIFDEYERARGLLDALIELSAARGERIAYASLRGVRSYCMLGLGRLADADADAEDVLRLSADTPTASVHALGPARFSLGMSRLCQGDLRGASEALDPHGAPTPPTGSPMAGWVDVARGWMALEGGDPAAAAGAFERAGRAFTAAGGSGMVCEWRSGLSLATAALGEHQRSRDLAAEELELARHFGSPRLRSRALRTIAALAPDPERAVELFAAAVDELRDSDAVLAQAWAHVEHGASLRRCRRRAESRAALRTGLDLARATGARALERIAVDELRAAGARRVDLAGGGAAALTPAERRVAELAVNGRTNADIARSLFVSRKTVESHLGRAYRKLGITGRDDLATHLDPNRLDITG